jgi:hypothetical protein
VAKRIGELQTGNSRRITIIAEMSDASPALEARIHSKLDEWNVTGEWFARDQLVAQAAAAEGFGPWLRRLATTSGPSLSIRRTDERPRRAGARSTRTRSKRVPIVPRPRRVTALTASVLYPRPIIASSSVLNRRILVRSRMP